MTTEIRLDKQCSKCKEVKPISLFTKRTKSSDGLSYWCKTCQKPAPIEKPAAQAKPVVVCSDQKSIVKKFIKTHLSEHGEACDLYFSHRIRYEHPTVAGEIVTRTINDLVRAGEIKATRSEVVDLARLSFFAIA